MTRVLLEYLVIFLGIIYVRRKDARTNSFGNVSRGDYYFLHLVGTWEWTRRTATTGYVGIQPSNLSARHFCRDSESLK